MNRKHGRKERRDNNVEKHKKWKQRRGQGGYSDAESTITQRSEVNSQQSLLDAISMMLRRTDKKYEEDRKLDRERMELQKEKFEQKKRDE